MVSSQNGFYGLELYPKAASPDLCERLKRYFDITPKSAIARGNNPKRKSFQGIFINKDSSTNMPLFQETDVILRGCFSTYFDKMIADPSIAREMKEGIYSFDARMKSYGVGDHFSIHSDVTGIEGILRRFAWIMYLNEGFEGGDTVFRSGEGEIARVNPKQGLIAIFPIHEIYMHEGEKVTKGTKYIMNGFTKILLSSLTKEATNRQHIDEFAFALDQTGREVLEQARIKFPVYRS